MVNGTYEMTDECDASRRVNGQLTVDHVDVGERYTHSLYWALATTSSLGFGNGPKPTSVVEYLFAIGCQVAGAILYATIFGNVAQLIQKIDAQGVRFRQQQERISEFANFHRLPSQLSAKLHAYNRFLFAVNRGFDVGEISAALPENLQQQVLLQMHEKLVRSVPLFQACDDSFIGALVMMLKPQVLLRNDICFRAGERSRETFFVQAGRLEVLDQSETIVYTTLYSVLLLRAHCLLAFLSMARQT